jgi:hypothetical protein
MEISPGWSLNLQDNRNKLLRFFNRHGFYEKESLKMMVWLRHFFWLVTMPVMLFILYGLLVVWTSLGKLLKKKQST